MSLLNVLAVLAAAVSTGHSFTNASTEVGTLQKTIEAAGYDWTYHVHIPKSYDGKTATALVFVLHGAGGSGDMYLSKNGWSDISDKAGFIVCAPTGLPALPRQSANFLKNPNLWDSGQLQDRSPRARVDDLAFFDALIMRLRRDYNIDKNRIYLTGHSNGAGMTFRLGAERSDVFAAIAPVMGQYAVKAVPRVGVPTLAIFGEKDPLCLWDGGERTLPWGKSTVPPAMESIEGWAKALRCSTTPTSHTNRGGLERWEYGPGKDKATFSVIKIMGQGHNWPGGQSSGLPAALVGPNVKTLDATKTIWEFFRDHHR